MSETTVSGHSMEYSICLPFVIRLSGLDGNEQKMDAEMDSGITNTGASEKTTPEKFL
ncbi:hypothetical protein T03_10282 [Trichinella britovi]|uniref:Uncharacterized protein n=1 Tax=Trichinella britovi TaxID=45882 RepID=A0A0V1ASB9_TRIBR|nr:hypothetical protein T03_10282 [Trichinella britovi]